MRESRPCRGRRPNGDGRVARESSQGRGADASRLACGAIRACHHEGRHETVADETHRRRAPREELHFHQSALEPLQELRRGVGALRGGRRGGLPGLAPHVLVAVCECRSFHPSRWQKSHGVVLIFFFVVAGRERRGGGRRPGGCRGRRRSPRPVLAFHDVPLVGALRGRGAAGRGGVHRRSYRRRRGALERRKQRRQAGGDRGGRGEGLEEPCVARHGNPSAAAEKRAARWSRRRRALEAWEHGHALQARGGGAEHPGLARAAVGLGRR
mmetsp:Transcript_13597/g.39611  ORF Transcript_13597/g.39611 Transcript_13597/m.39611 type:complete len:269 (-) Transcript_13597:1847-2653(-)